MIVAETVLLDTKRKVNKTKYVKWVEAVTTAAEEKISWKALLILIMEGKVALWARWLQQKCEFKIGIFLDITSYQLVIIYQSTRVYVSEEFIFINATMRY